MSLLERVSQCPKICSKVQGEHICTIPEYNSREALQLQKDQRAGNKHLDVVLNIFEIVVWEVHGLTVF